VEETLSHLTFWHWWVLGVILLILEVFAPGTFFLWLAVAAGVVGTLLLAMPDLAWHWQLLLFSVLSLGAVVAWRVYLARHPTVSDQPALNRRGEQYLGRTFVLLVPVENGRGKITVDDSTWRVEGPDCAAGTRVKVVAADGTLLRIEPVS